MDNSPLEGVKIIVFDTGMPGMWEIGITDSSGMYTATQVPTLPAHIMFVPSDGFHVAEYYNDSYERTGAEVVDVNAGSVITGIDASLTLGGQIRGQVAGATDGQPIAEACVRIHDTDDELAAGPFYGTSPYHCGETHESNTDSTGTYTVTAVVPGSYDVEFAPPWDNLLHVAEYYSDTYTIANAETVTVTAGGINSGINALLTLGGQIRGKVTSSRNNELINDLVVTTYAMRGSETISRTTITGPGGAYTVTNLLPGANRVHFDTGASWTSSWPHSHHNEYYDNQLTLALADSVTVTSGTVSSGIDAELSLHRIAQSLATSTGVPNAMAMAFDYFPLPIYSTDGGKSWQPIHTIAWAEPDHSYQSLLDMTLAPRGDPGSPMRILVSDYHGLYRSEDLGQVWTRQAHPPESSFTDFDSIVPSPADPDRLYATATRTECVFPGCITIYGLYTSGDAGLTWQELRDPPGGYGRLVPSPSLPERVYSESFSSWYRSDDGGHNWYDLDLAADELVLDAEAPQRLYVVLENTGMRSNDGERLGLIGRGSHVPRPPVKNVMTQTSIFSLSPIQPLAVYSTLAVNRASIAAAMVETVGSKLQRVQAR